MDQNETISAREFDNTIKALTNTMADGFSGLNQRLDVLNGKTDVNARDIKTLSPLVAEQGVKIKNLDREVFEKPRRRRDDHDDDGMREREREPKEPDDRPVTRREVNIAVAVATVAVVVVIWFFTMFGPQMIEGAK